MRYIYRIQFPNGKNYIGQTGNIKKRIQPYKSLNCKNQVLLYHALCKYTLEKCLIEILNFCIDDDSDDLERKYIKNYCSNNINFGYNLDSGGHKNKTHSEETKLKMSKNNVGMKNKKHTKETIEKIKKSNIGKHFHCGHTQSQDTKNKISKANTGRKHTDEELNKMRNRNFSDIHKVNLRKSHAGKKFTNTHVENLSVSALKREKLTCPHCDKTMDISNAKQWHFDNCKFKNKEVTCHLETK